MLLLTAVLATTLAPRVSAEPGADVPMELYYDESATQTPTGVNGASQWEGASLPIGNGILGANVFGEVAEEHLTLNEETLWSGGRGSVSNYDGGNPDPNYARKVYDGLANYYVNGTRTSYNMENLRGDPRNSSGYDDGYQPLGDLWLNFGSHRSEQGTYRRSLNLDQGLATVHYTSGGVSYDREYFVSHPDKVLVARLTASDTNELNLSVSFTSKQAGAATAVEANGTMGTITVSGAVSNNGLLHNTQIAVVADQGRVTAGGNELKISNADTVTVYLTAATDYANKFSDGKGTDYYYRTGETREELEARVKSTLDGAVNKGYEAVKNAHVADYQNLYSRVKLDLGQKAPGMTTDQLLSAYKNGGASPAQQRYLETLVFQYGRYLLISGSREDSQLPTTLQGIWNDTSRIDWNSDIHTNINLQMNYWLSGNCNLTECAMPLVNYMAKLKEPGGRTVECYTGCKNGIMAHTQNTPFGYTAPGWDISTWGWSPAAATWLMQNCFDYYQYSGDLNTLRNTIYPMMKDQVLMYEQLLREKDGRKVMPIALSPEIGPVTSGNTFEQSLIWQLYADTIEAAKLLKLDAESISGWQATMDALKPIEIGQSGQVKEWYNETTLNSVADTSGHRHLSNLLGLYPGNLFDTEAEIAAAKVSLNNKNFGKVGSTWNNPEGGWTYGQMINSWARVGEGENAYFCVNQMLKSRFLANLWDYHNPAIFQIDGNYGYSAGVAEMLVQSNLGYINFLPAISSAWANGSVSGLLTEGSVEVSMTWENSKVTQAILTPKYDGKCSVKNPFAGKTLAVNGKAVTCDENGIATFDATAGQTYTLSAMKASKPAEAVRNEDGSIGLAWEAKPGVTYTIYRKEITK